MNNTIFDHEWKFEKIEKFPFGFRIHSGNGEVILQQEAIYRSTEQKSRLDNEQGVGFRGDEINEATEAIKTQDLIGRLFTVAPELYSILQTALSETPKRYGTKFNEKGDMIAEYPPWVEKAQELLLYVEKG